MYVDCMRFGIKYRQNHVPRTLRKRGFGQDSNPSRKNESPMPLPLDQIVSYHNVCFSNIRMWRYGPVYPFSVCYARLDRQ